MPRCPAQLVHRQPVPALVARAGVPPAAPPATDDHRHVDQVLVVLVAEEALAQLGQPVLSALQGAHKLLLPVAQQDVVVGPLADEGLVVIEVPAGRPQARVGVVDKIFLKLLQAKREVPGAAGSRPRRTARRVCGCGLTAGRLCGQVRPRAYSPTAPSWRASWSSSTASGGSPRRRVAKKVVKLHEP